MTTEPELSGLPDGPAVDAARTDAEADHGTASTPTAAAPRRLCPYLIGREGDWRGLTPSRDHRCSAVDPPAALASDKQRRLCLGVGHRDCSTYLAARRSLVPGLEDAPIDQRAGHLPSRWSLPRTAPVLIERGRPTFLRHPRTRSLGQVALVVLMAVAFVLLVIARSG